MIPNKGQLATGDHVHVEYLPKTAGIRNLVSDQCFLAKT